MAIIKPLRGFSPKFGTDCYLTENCVVVGDVIIGDKCTIWYNAVLRGDVNSIHVGNNVNIQDGVVIHCTYQDSVTIIEDNVSIGHNAVIHGARLEEGVLIGMGAIIMDHAVIGRNSIIAAGALVTKNTIVEPGSIYGGVPAKKIKSYDPEELGKTTLKSARNYLMYREWYREGSEE